MQGYLLGLALVLGLPLCLLLGRAIVLVAASLAFAALR